MRRYSLGFTLLTFALLLSFILMPDFSLSAISTNIRWRPQMINLYNSFRLNVGDRLFHDTLAGDDGWLFYMDAVSIADYQRTNLLDEPTLATLRQQLDQLSQDLESQGITLLVVIPPNKSTVYPQYMPSQIPVLAEISLLDQFVQAMGQTGRTRVVDLRATLAGASREQQVYYRTDTHWTDMGAYYAYVQIMQGLASQDPRLAPHPLSHFRMRPGRLGQRDLAQLLGLTNLLESGPQLVLKGSHPLEVSARQLPDGTEIRRVTNQNTRLPKLLVFQDSFYYSLSDFIEPHFKQTTSVPYTESPGVWTLDWINKRDPDVVIIEAVERNLYQQLARLLATQPP
jgi:hypothetical protein